MKTLFSSEVLETGTIVTRCFGKWGVVSASYRPWDLGYAELDLLNRLGGRLDGIEAGGYLKSFAEKEGVDPRMVFIDHSKFLPFLNYLGEKEGGEFSEILGNLEIYPVPT